MRDVESLEVDPPERRAGPSLDDGGAPEPDRTARHGGRRTGGRWGGRAPWRQRWWWLVLGVVIVALGVPYQVRADREDRRTAQLTRVGGVVTALDGPARELWSAARPESTESYDVAGVLVFVSRVSADSVSAQGVEARTGTVVWSLALTGTASSAGRFAFARGPVDGPQRAVAAAVVGGEASHLVVLDPQTGHVMATYAATPAEAISDLGTDIAIGSVVDGGYQVVRCDPRTGRTVWTAQLTSSSTSGTAGAPTTLQAFGDGLLVSSGPVAWQISASGVVTQRRDGLPTETIRSFWKTPGGHVLLLTTSPYSSDSSVHDVGTGATIATGSDDRLVIGVDDGSAPNLLLTDGSRLTAWNLDAGTRRWQTPNVAESVVVLDGAVYSAGGQVLRAQDVHTGALRWAVRTGAGRAASIETDGSSLLLLIADSVGSRLTAVDLTDGSTLWTSPLSGAPDSLLVLAGHLFALTSGGGMVALG